MLIPANEQNPLAPARKELPGDNVADRPKADHRSPPEHHLDGIAGAFLLPLTRVSVVLLGFGQDGGEPLLHRAEPVSSIDLPHIHGQASDLHRQARVGRMQEKPRLGCWIPEVLPNAHRIKSTWPLRRMPTSDGLKFLLILVGFA